MTDSDPQSGDTYPNAGRASGYTDDQGRAIGENLVNRITELMVGPQTKIIQLAAQLDASVKVQDQRFQYMLGQLGAHLEKEDARHLAYDQAEQTTLTALTSVAHRLDEITSYVQQSVTIAREALTVSKAGAARLGKLEKNVRSLDKRMDASEADRAAIRAQLVALDTDALFDIRLRLVALEDWKEQVAALRADFSALSARIGGALPTEADQDLSAQLRAERDDGNDR